MAAQAARIETAKLAVHYTMLLCWEPLKAHATRIGFPWPLEATKEAALEAFVTTGKAIGLTHLNERGDHDLAWFSRCVQNKSACGAPAARGGAGGIREEPVTKCWD